MKYLAQKKNSDLNTAVQQQSYDATAHPTEISA